MSTHATGRMLLRRGLTREYATLTGNVLGTVALPDGGDRTVAQS